MKDRNCPIIAVSSGASQASAVALIRISGFKSFDSLKPFFKRDISALKANESRVSEVINRSGEVLDQVLVTKFVAPHSFTGEHVIELGVHGNPINIERIIENFLEVDEMQRADPGEFSFRAFKNKKLSLTQVEGLDLFLHAKSKQVLDLGLKSLHGELHSEYEKLRESFLELSSSVELNIDFLEDIGEEQGEELLESRFSTFKNNILRLSERVQGDVDQLLSPKVVLLGKTNAGKSSLFNAILGNNRAIVSDVHGTTRDYVSENLKIKDAHFRLVDTAGLRESSDQVEVEGIKRTLEQIENAFFKILVVNPFDISKEEIEAHKYDLLVCTHEDQANCYNKINGLGLKNGDYIGLSLSSGPIGPIRELKSIISDTYESLLQDEPILIERHREIILDIMNLSNNIVEFSDMGILSGQLRELGLLIEELIGVVPPEDVLNHIFSNFCIGK